MAQDIIEGIKAFKKDKNAVLLDVRTFEEYENQHINGSINIPIQTLGQIRLKVKNLSTPLWVLLASSGIWSIVIGVMIAIAHKNEEKEKAKKMLINFVIGLVVIAVIVVACPYLIRGIAALVT